MPAGDGAVRRREARLREKVGANGRKESPFSRHGFDDEGCGEGTMTPMGGAGRKGGVTMAMNRASDGEKRQHAGTRRQGEPEEKACAGTLSAGCRGGSGRRRKRKRRPLSCRGSLALRSTKRRRRAAERARQGAFFVRGAGAERERTGRGQPGGAENGLPGHERRRTCRKRAGRPARAPVRRER